VIDNSFYSGPPQTKLASRSLRENRRPRIAFRWNPVGTGRVPQGSPVRTWAEEEGLPGEAPPKLLRYWPESFDDWVTFS
jgi:hypothetical protein